MTSNRAQQSPKQSAAFVQHSKAVMEDLGDGIKRQILGYGPEIMLCRVWFETGAVGTRHTHPHSQSSYVESGRFKVFIDGVEREMGPGDCFTIAPDLLHGAECLEQGVLLDCFSPMREDFLDAAPPAAGELS